MRKLLQLFNWLRFLYAINGAVFGLILGVVGNKLSGSGELSSIPYLITIFMLLGAVMLFMEIKRKRVINVSLHANTARTEFEKEKAAKKGLITVVSLYNPLKSSTAGKLSIEEREKAAINKNYHALDLENSNLQPVIEAVCSHKPAIKHCWLIGTADKEKTKGSIMYQDVLIEFLKKEKGINCNFYCGEKYAIPLDDDALICEKTYKMIKEIFKEAFKFRLEAKDIITDCTGGTKSMTSGMILSCLDGDNDIQLIGTKYDALAKPTGGLFPVYISFEPETKN